ncbi:hypothetical protein BsWGS_24106 [Bradybaena similaris]
MEDLDSLTVSTTAFTIFLLILSALGILWTVFCSWLTGRKKRQRVASNAHSEDLALHAETSLPRTKGKSPDRYSGVEEVIILPIDDLGRCLHLPTIVVTPPTPQTPVDKSSPHSESSIGTPVDLTTANRSINNAIDYSDEMGTESESHGIEGNIYAGGSMGNILDCDPLTDAENNIVPQGDYPFEDMTFPTSQTNWIEDGSGVTSGHSQGEINCSIQMTSPDYITNVANIDNSHDKNDNLAFAVSRQTS